MAVIDVFNGDADGICALAQLRNACPADSQLVTGVKRDIQLLNKVTVTEGDQLTVLDISLDKNRQGLEAALANGAEVFYVDHHYAGEIPENSQLTTLINTAADVCTSLLVNKHLGGQFVEWAIVGAFGDNLKKSANVLAKPLNLSEQQLTQLDNLGVYINYNGYGSDISDLHFPPAELFQCVLPFANPFDFISGAKDSFEKLESGYHADMKSAASQPFEFANDQVAVVVLPNEAWARRVSGVYGNDLANRYPSRAHAVVTVKANGNYLVSIRAPLENKTGADEFCRRFPTGGGRAAAAGINDLPKEQLADFINQFQQFYGEELVR